MWNDTKFLDGYHGKFVVLVRRGEGRWYVVSGEPTVKTLTLDLRELSVRGVGTLVTDADGGNLSFRRETVHLTSDKRQQVTLQPQGGFVMGFK